MSRLVQNHGEEKSAAEDKAKKHQSQSFSLKHLAQSRSITSGNSAASEKAPPKAKRKGGRPSTWGLHFEQLKTKMATKYPKGGFVKSKGINAGLSNWVKRQRYDYHRNLLADEKIKNLESIGFLWEEPSPAIQAPPQGKKRSPKGTNHNKSQKKKSSTQNKQSSSTNGGKSSQTRLSDLWETQFNRLAEGMKIHYPNGGYVASSKFDKQLDNWIQRQRRLYRMRDQGQITSLTNDRIEKLESINFHWENQESSEPPAQVARAPEVVADSNVHNTYRPNVLDVVEPATSDEEGNKTESEGDSEDETRLVDDVEDQDSQHQSSRSISDSEEEESLRAPWPKKNRKSPARAGKRKGDDRNEDSDSDKSEEDRKPPAKRKRSHHSESEVSNNESCLDDLIKHNLPRLLSNQLDHLETVKKENTRLMEEVINLRTENQDLKRRNRSLEEKKQDLQESYQTERQRRKQAERQLKKLKK